MEKLPVKSASVINKIIFWILSSISSVSGRDNNSRAKCPSNIQSLLVSLLSNIAFVIPKSVITKCPSLWIKKLLVFTSLCNIPFACNRSRIDTASARINFAVFESGRLSFIFDDTSPPGTKSTTQRLPKTVSNIVQFPNMMNHHWWCSTLYLV